MQACVDVVCFTRWPDEDPGRLVSEIKETGRMARTVSVLDVSRDHRDLRTVTQAWNALAAQGSGEFIFFVQSDVRLSPGWDERLVGCLETFPNVGVALPAGFGEERPVRLVEEGLPAPLPPGDPTRTDLEKLADWARMYEGVLYTFEEHNASFFAALMRRSLWQVLKGFDTRFRIHGHDHDFQRRMARITPQVAASVRSSPAFVPGPPRSVGWMAEKCADMQAERAHMERIRESIRSVPFREWDQLSETERSNILYDPAFGIPRPDPAGTAAKA